MSLEWMYRTMRSVYFEKQPRPRRKLRRLKLTRKSEEKKISDDAITTKKVAKKSHWCTYCETIGRQCRRK